MTKEDILSLPIDQYSRQAWVADIIDSQRSKGQKFKILDVGGHKGKTRQFHSNDSVTVCDLFDVKEKGYVKTDGKSLPFKDQSFDFVVSFDTYEHVPRAQREGFLKEAYRVAKHAVLVAAPFDEEKNGPVSVAEKALNQYHKDLYGTDHQWLKEHIDYAIPTTAEMEKQLSKLGFDYISMPTNDIDVWLMIQTLYFSIELDTDLRGRVDDVNRMFNRDFKKYDRSLNSAYRHIFITSRSKETLTSIQTYLDNLPTDVKNKVDFMSFAFSVLGKKYRDTTVHDQYLEAEVEKAFTENKALRKQNMQLMAEQERMRYEPRVVRPTLRRAKRAYTKFKKGKEQ